MGELQLEIILSRLQREYHIKAQLTRPIIQYMETIENAIENNWLCISNTTGLTPGANLLEIELSLHPHRLTDCTVDEEFIFGKFNYSIHQIPLLSDSNSTCVNFSANAFSGHSNSDIPASHRMTSHQENTLKSCIQSALRNVLLSGTRRKLPISGIRIEISKVHLTNPNLMDLSEKEFITKIEHSFYQHMLNIDDSMRRTEPMMGVSIYLNSAVYVKDILKDLNSREPEYIEYSTSSGNDTTLIDSTTIEALIPMRKISRYINTLRKLSKGNVYYTILPKYYKIRSMS